MVETIVQRDMQGNIGIWPNGGLLLTHEEIDAVIAAFQTLKAKWPSEQIEENNKTAPRKDREYPEQDNLEKSSAKDADGYIYVILSEKLYKIGRTKYPKKRMGNHRAASPYPIELILLAKVEDYITVEDDLLEQLASKRYKGEWFTLDKQDVEAISKFVVSRGGTLVES